MGAVLAMTWGQGGAAAPKPAPVVEYGPAPEWSRFQQLAEDAIKSHLVDPDSVRFTWSSGYHQGGYRPGFKTVTGYVACGTFNARNRMGGYNGADTFLVVIDYDRVLYVQTASADDQIAQTCADGIRTGLLPPVPIVAAKPTAAAETTAGLVLQAMPDGAYVASVTAGSPAAAAGLKPGMVIGSVNGIGLAGLGENMTRLIDAASGDVTLTIIGGTTVKMHQERTGAVGGAR
jgi:hypothetical protein